MVTSRTIPEVVAEQAAAVPDAVAVVGDDRHVTYAELASEVAAFAGRLRDLGVGPGGTVGLLCPNRVEWVVAAVATMQVGAQVAAFNTWSKRWDLDHMLRHSRCEVLVASTSVGQSDLMSLVRDVLPEVWAGDGPGWRSGSYPDLRDLVVIGDGDIPSGASRLGSVTSGPYPTSVATCEDTALVLYTSGSTARPKAVRLQQGATVEHASEVAERVGLTAQDVVLVPVPLFWSYGGANALPVCLVAGCTLVLQETFDAGRALDAIEELGCTAAYVLPNITRALLEHPRFAPQRVRTLRRGMTIGSVADVRATIEELGVTEVTNAYGATEMYGGAAVTPYTWSPERRSTSQGLPLPGTTITVCDPVSGERVAEGEVGELVVRGNVTPGYLDQAEANAASFTADGAFRTGDLGRVDSHGEVHYVGRVSEMIRVGGINVSPLEVEDFLLTHDAVVGAAVVGTDDAARGQVAVAYVRLAEGADLGEDELISWCRERVAAYKVPARLVVSGEDFPRTTTGKLARSVLRDDAGTRWPL